jgi:prolyl-tRNA editing enzyme YbaK/EbsC (Cys-tRNA(Pro) deacylase)
MGAWPETVEHVSTYLRETGAEGRIEEFEVETATAADAAHAAGCDVGSIVKSLIVMCDERPVVALVPGDRKGDMAKIAQAAGGLNARVARAGEVEAVTGFAPGAVAPFPLDRVDRVLIERLLLARDELWVGAGSTRHMAVLPTRELIRLTKASPADLIAAD